MVDDYMQDKVIDYRKTRHWKTKILIGTDDKFPYYFKNVAISITCDIKDDDSYF